MACRFASALILTVLLTGPALAQDDYLMPGETSPQLFKDDSPPVHWGWKWRFQMGVHTHLKRDAFWDHRDSYFNYDNSETRFWLSWDLGRMYLEEDLDGWGGGVFGWVGGDYEGAWGLKGYRRWSLGRDGGAYFQAGPGIILGADAAELDYGAPGWALEAELGVRYLAVSTGVTFLPYTGRGGGRVWNGQEYVDTPGEEGWDVAWNLGTKVSGPVAGVTTGIMAVALIIALQSFSGLD